MILEAGTGQIVDANPFLLEMLGYTREELLGKRLWEIGFFRDRALAEAASATLRQEGYIRYEDLPLEAKDGRRREVEFVSNLYEVEHHKVIQCNIRDITERKRAEEALREREARYRKLFDTGDSAVFLVECGTQRLLDANATAVKLYGYSREEFLRMTAADVSAEPNRMRRAIEAGNTHIPLRWHRRKDGTAFPVEITASFVEYEGRRIHMVVIRDISREQQREAAVRELSGRLMRLQDKERRHLARELHDTTAQELAAISMNIAVVRARTSELSADVRTILADTAMLTERCASEIRTMTYLLHPPVLEA
ncbi:MAG: PAS domain S-box protein, partial [Opitutaceae bacterium]